MEFSDHDYSEDGWTPPVEPNPALAPASRNSAEDGKVSLDDDVAEYMELHDQLLGEQVEGSTRPAGTVHYTNVGKNPFDSFHMRYEMVRRRGYGVHFIDDARTNNGQPHPGGLAVAVDIADRAAVQAIDDQIMDLEFAPLENRPPLFAGFLSMVTDGQIYPFSLNPRHPHFRQVTETLTPEEHAILPNALVRGFLTSVVMRGVQDAQDPISHRRLSPEDRTLYEKIRQEEGLRPFNAEALYGLAGVAIAYVLDPKRNTDIPPPAARQRTEPDY